MVKHYQPVYSLNRWPIIKIEDLGTMLSRSWPVIFESRDPWASISLRRSLESENIHRMNIAGDPGGDGDS